MKIEIAGELSYTQQPYIGRAVLQAISDMPDGVKNSLSEVKTILARTMADIFPDAPETTMRGNSNKTLK